MKTLLSFAFIFLFCEINFSQTLEVNGINLTFGSNINSGNNCYSENNQIESGCNYIKVVEGDCPGIDFTGDFYDDKLVCLDFIIINDDPFPVLKPLEAILKNYQPYRQENVLNYENITVLYEYYKTDEFFVARSSVRMSTLNQMKTGYLIIPIVILNYIRKQHPDYLNAFFPN